MGNTIHSMGTIGVCTACGRPFTPEHLGKCPTLDVDRLETDRVAAEQKATLEAAYVKNLLEEAAQPKRNWTVSVVGMQREGTGIARVANMLNTVIATSEAEAKGWAVAAFLAEHKGYGIEIVQLIEIKD